MPDVADAAVIDASAAAVAVAIKRLHKSVEVILFKFNTKVVFSAVSVKVKKNKVRQQSQSIRVGLVWE